MAKRRTEVIEFTKNACLRKQKWEREKFKSRLVSENVFCFTFNYKIVTLFLVFKNLYRKQLLEYI